MENIHVLEYTDFLQYCDTDQRTTVHPFSLYLHYKDNDQGNVLVRIETLFTQKPSAPAYKAAAATEALMEVLREFSNPAEHTRTMHDVLARKFFLSRRIQQHSRQLQR